MDPGFKVTKEYPRKNANILSKATFTWMIGYFYKGIKRGVTVNDLFRTIDADSSEYLGNKLEDNWKKQLLLAKTTKKNPSLLRAVVNTFLCQYMVFGCILFFQYCIIRISQPLLLGYLLRIFNGGANPENPTSAKYITGGLLAGAVYLFTVITHHTNLGQQTVGMRVRIAVSTLIYRKMLRLNKKSIGETAAGKVVNLLANDVTRFDFAATALNFLWIMPFQVIIISFFVWRTVGVASLAGIFTMLMLTLPIQVLMGKFSAKYRGKIAVRTDYRVRLMNEIVSGIQVIKMYAWEKPFEKLVKLARIDEMKMVRASNYIRAVLLSLMIFTERTTLYVTLITFILTDNALSSDITYTLSPYFNLLQISLAIFMPLAMQMGAESLVSFRRLTEFLMLDELEKSNIVKTDDKTIDINNVNAKWSEETGILKNINFIVPPGSLCALIGPVGSGKSSILQLLLGELPTEAGKIKIGGTISYASQEPWLFGSTVRGNILFGQEFDKYLYSEVIKACSLQKDFKQFPHGDRTMVGERGVSLSGGQRARINLARAIYRQADIYLLDDPLSAVDTHVGKHLFSECIMKYLKGRTRILVTHQLQYLKQADLIIVFNNGTIEAQGTYEQLSKANLDFTNMLVAADETSEDRIDKLREIVNKRKESIVSVKSTISDLDQEMEIKRMEEEVIIPNKSIIWDYIGAAGNICMIILVITIIAATQIISSGNDYFVSWWTGQEETRNAEEILNETSIVNNFIEMTETGLIKFIEDLFGISAISQKSESSILERADDDDLIETNIALYIYSGFIGGLILITAIRSYLFFRCASNASQNLHSKMFNSLLKTPMRFFDTNPSGRILNRFSKDTGAMDEWLPRTLSEAIQVMLSLFGALILIAIANYWMIIPIAVLLSVFFLIRKWFVTTAKSIKHVEGIAKSPVFSLLNSTLNGISTIRASGAQYDLIKEFDSHQNVHTSAWILTITTSVSFGLWLDLFSATFFAVNVFGFILLSAAGNVSGALAGMAISQSMMLAGVLQHGLRQTAEVVNQFTSVERIMTYTKLDQEGPFDSLKDRKPSKRWPQNGKIDFKKMYLRYGMEEEPVLKNLNLQIYAGEKIGIVGRTGAGKSSLISALFRLSPLEGEITIDDLNTQEIGLHDVRTKISIIPQEPVLFSATLRYNLDPFNEFDDQDLWAALDEVELKEAVPFLDYKVTEGGGNFSVGQRQLICLARAIIRRNKILILDEATANVDPRTDGLIQTTIRNKFKDCTVLTIAHRLNTIMDADKVLVMDSGRIVEFDHPHLLLQDPNGYFTKLVMETGPAMSATLRDTAKQCFQEVIQKGIAKRISS